MKGRLGAHGNNDTARSRMKHTTVLLLSFAFPMLCLATTPLPYSQQCRFLDQILTATASQSPINVIALKMLEQVALGRAADISHESEAQVGIAPDVIQAKEFTVPTVRACAYWRIGEAELPEAVEFLSKLKQTDIGIDISGEIWPTVQAALSNALLNSIADPQLKVQFLERTVIDRAPATSWAVEQLCNRGPVASLAIVQQYIRQVQSGQRGEDRVRFCETRMQVISRDPDRIKALGSVLSVGNSAEQEDLIRWASSQLSEMRSPKADAELKRFMTEIEKVPGGSTEKHRLSEFKSSIEREQQNRGPLR